MTFGADPAPNAPRPLADREKVKSKRLTPIKQYDHFMTDGAKHKGGRGHTSPNKYERLTVTLPPEQRRRLDELAAALGVSRSEMVNRVIDAYQAPTGDTHIHPKASVKEENAAPAVAVPDELPARAAAGQGQAVKLSKRAASALRDLENSPGWWLEYDHSRKRYVMTQGHGSESYALGPATVKELQRAGHLIEFRKDALKLHIFP